MTLLAKAVAKNIGTGLVGSTVLVTGVGFQPKAVFAFASRRTENVDAQGQQTNTRSWGMGGDKGGGVIGQHVNCSYSGHGVVHPSAVDNEEQRTHSDNLIMVPTSTGNIDGAAALTSFNADGCLLTITNAFPSDIRVIFWFVGGTDILDVAVGTFIGPFTGTTPFNTDVTGLGFTPVTGQAIGFLLGSTSFADNDNSIDSDLAFGAFVRATEQAVLMSGSNDKPATLSQSISVCHDLECLVSPNTSLANTNRRAQFVSWIADGFRLQYNEVSIEDVVTQYMVINGGNWAIRPFSTATSLADVPITGVGIGTPAGGMVFSHMKAETGQDAISSDQADSVGVFDSPSSRYAVAEFQKDNLATTAVATAIQHDEVYINIDENGTILGLMDIKTIDADGVTFTMDDADPSICFGWTVLVGSSGGGTIGPLSRQILIPLSVLDGQQMLVGVISTGHSASDPYPTVVDTDVAGDIWTRIGETESNRRATLFWKKAGPNTAGKIITIGGGITSLAGVLGSYKDIDPLQPITNLRGLFAGTNKTIAGFIPDHTDSMIVIIILSMDNQAITDIACVNPGLLNKRFEDLSNVSSGCGAVLADKAQFAGPVTTGPFTWTQVTTNNHVFTLALKALLGQGTSWTTTTLVDEGGEGQTVEREVFGSTTGLTFVLDPTTFEYGGHYLSGVKGSETDLVTPDRVIVRASCISPATVGISYTTDGGATFSEELVVALTPSLQGIFSGSGWKPVTVNQFQVRVRPLSGNAIIHRVILHAQPRGRAV